MSRWQIVNARAGLVVAGLPVVLAVPALIATVAEFGARDGLSAAVPAVLIAAMPLVLWVCYLRRRRPIYRFHGWWVLVGVATVVLVAGSPLRFWSVPVLVVVLSEATRGVVAAARSRPRR